MHPPSPNAETVALVLLLTRYLRDNPLACDTLEGIARWWLPVAPHEAPPDDLLQQALDWLLAAQMIERLDAADGRARYRRVPGDSDFEARVRAALVAPPPGADDAPRAGKRVH